MSKCYLKLILTISFVIFYTRSDAVVFAAPVVAIGIGEGLMLGAGALAAMGLLTQMQADTARADVQAWMPRFDFAEAKAAVTRSIHAMAGQSTTSKLCEANAKKAAGECLPEDREDPFKCCPDFMKKFIDGGSMTTIGKFAYRVFYFSTHGATVQCCFEWDSTHGRFEVFRKSNHQAFTHSGERSCARPEDQDSELCQATYPEKADFNGRHAPRRGCP